MRQTIGVSSLLMFHSKNVSIFTTLIIKTNDWRDFENKIFIALKMLVTIVDILSHVCLIASSLLWGYCTSEMIK